MFEIIGPDTTSLPVPRWTVWSSGILFVAVIVAFYLLRSIGLCVMAKKQQIKNPYLAFIPGVWMFTACKLVGRMKIFGTTFERGALFLCIIYTIGKFLALFYQFLVYFPVVGNFIAGNDLVVVLISDAELMAEHTQGLTPIWSNFFIYGGEKFVDPYYALGVSPNLLNAVMSSLSYVSLIFDVACIVIEISLLISLFKKYAPKHFILFSVLSWLGIFGPLVFACRNKEPVDYSAYARNRYNAGYSDGNPYGGPTPYQRPQTPPSPFSEFDGKVNDPSEPFAEFNQDDKN